MRYAARMWFVEFDREFANRIDGMADRLEGGISDADNSLEQSLARLSEVGTF